MLRDNRNSSNCFQKLIFAEKSVFAVTTLDMNNLLNRFWIIWPQVIHFCFSEFSFDLFCWHFCFWNCWHMWILCWQNVVIFLVQYLCFTVLTVWLSHWGKWSIYGAKKWCDPTFKVNRAFYELLGSRIMNIWSSSYRPLELMN